MKSCGLVLLSLSLTGGWLGSAQPLAAAEPTCYQDDSGRIVQRRRPGYVPVPCPTVSRTPAPPQQAPVFDAETSVPTPGAAPIPGGVPPGSGPASSPVASPVGAPLPPASGAASGSSVSAPPLILPSGSMPMPQLQDFPPSEVVPDRWRVVEGLGYRERWFDPYNRNVLKADRPVHGEWFFNVSAIADTVLEVREVPTPVGASSTARPGSLDIFGDDEQVQAIQNLATEFVYYKGNTVFKPPDWEIRLTPVFSLNYLRVEEVQVVNADARRGRSRRDDFVGLQAAFVDRHLRNVSDNYDFDSIRVGIQPFSSDFRGFLFQDNQLGARLFGTRDNNKWQYNLAYFRRLEKDTNSGLNDVTVRPRRDDVVVANLYRQDFPVLGFTSQVTALYNRNREDDEIYLNKNGFVERPASLGLQSLRKYDVGYAGYSGDGHFGRMNLSTSLYYAYGEERPGAFVAGRPIDIRAFFGAAELSMDFDWIRPKLSLLFASGDEDPFDDRATGFDAVFENPQFAGGDTSYFIRQGIPLVGGGRVALAGRNSVLPALRSSKEEGQSNFTNPGLMLAGLGVDMDVLPTLRVSFNANALFFEDTTVLQVLRTQGRIDRQIGYDISASLIWRPLMSQNIVVRASYATLLAEDGFEALFPDRDPGYFLLNTVFAY